MQVDWRYKKKKDGSSFNNPNKVNMVENQVEEICAMVSKMKTGMVIELNMLAATKSSNW